MLRASEVSLGKQTKEVEYVKQEAHCVTAAQPPSATHGKTRVQAKQTAAAHKPECAFNVQVRDPHKPIGLEHT